MPLYDSDYNPSLLLKNAHLQTIYPTLFRIVRNPGYERERITTQDLDFIDLDWIRNNSKNLAIISHGMEGSSYSKYVVGMCRVLKQSGWDSLAWNFRGCSGEPNKQLRFYHSGASDDLKAVVDYAVSLNRYENIYLIGYSMGGNITLKYLGENSDNISQLIKKSITFGVPCNLKSSVLQLAKTRNIIYMRRFLYLLKGKMSQKSKLFPDKISLKDYHKIKNFILFDRIYTAPMHGFSSEEEYWEKSSSRQFLTSIKVPTLLVNSLDDPFLDKVCFPYEEADANEYLTLETPAYGGHIGFIDFNLKGLYWSEKRAIEFLRS